MKNIAIIIAVSTTVNMVSIIQLVVIQDENPPEKSPKLVIMFADSLVVEMDVGPPDESPMLHVAVNVTGLPVLSVVELLVTIALHIEQSLIVIAFVNNGLNPL